jgi:steroid delta-isomerase-like uncharacterized protein
MTKLETVQAFFDAYNQHQTDAMLACFSSDAMFEYVPYGEQGKGKIYESAAGIWGMFTDAFPDFTVQVGTVTETADGRVVAETVNGGTQAKDVMGIQNKGLSQHVPHVFFFKFGADNLITNLKAYWDNNSIYTQLKHTEVHA